MLDRDCQSKQPAKKFDVERFNLQKLSDVEVKEE